MTETRLPRWERLAFVVFLALVLAINLLPFFWMLTTSFKVQQEIQSTRPTLLPAHWTLVNYTNLTAGQVVGDYSGSLANSGERVALAMPHDAEDMIVVDEVLYEDGGRWGQWADGGGSSLELVDPRSDNRLAANWADSDETAKGAWTNIECTGVLDHGTNYSGASINELHVMLLKKGECLLDNVVVTNLSGPNRVTNSTFEAGLGVSFKF